MLPDPESPVALCAPHPCGPANAELMPTPLWGPNTCVLGPRMDSFHIPAHLLHVAMSAGPRLCISSYNDVGMDSYDQKVK